MNSIFKLIFFTLTLNLATGIIIFGIVDTGSYSGNVNGKIFSTESGNTFGITYNESYSRAFEESMDKTLSPTGQLEDQSNAIYRLLDKMNLGFLTTIKNAISNYLYGFPNLLESMFGPYMDPTFRVFIFGLAKTIVFIGYLVGIWLLFTGRAFDD